MILLTRKIKLYEEFYCLGNRIHTTLAEVHELQCEIKELSRVLDGIGNKLDLKNKNSGVIHHKHK